MSISWPHIRHYPKKSLVFGTSDDDLKKLPKPVLQKIFNLLGLTDLLNFEQTSQWGKIEAAQALRQHIIEQCKVDSDATKLYIFILIKKINSLFNEKVDEAAIEFRNEVEYLFNGRTNQSAILFKYHKEKILPLNLNDLLLVASEPKNFTTLQNLIRNKASQELSGSLEEFLKKVSFKQVATQKEMFSLLKKLGVNFDVQSESSETVLTLITKSNGGKSVAEAVEYLCEQKVDVNLSTESGITPLINAILNGDVETIKILLRYKVSLNPAKYWNNMRPLITAMQASHSEEIKKEIVSLLLKNGANPNISTISGYTPLTLRSTISSALIQLLCEANGSTVEQNEMGLNALHTAVLVGNLERVEILLKYNADPKLKTSYGRTTLSLAEEIQDPVIKEKMVTLLKTRIQSKE